jgi:hypothetical protein
MTAYATTSERTFTVEWVELFTGLSNGDLPKAKARAEARTLEYAEEFFGHQGFSCSFRHRTDFMLDGAGEYGLHTVATFTEKREPPDVSVRAYP